MTDNQVCQLYSGSCSLTQTCPGGQQYCGACNSCMPNTLTCNQWAAANCGVTGGIGGGACISGWCTSAATCSASGGTQGTYPGGSCSSGLVACCVSSGGGSGPTPTCVWNDLNFRNPSDFFMTVGQDYLIDYGYFPGGTTWVQGRYSVSPGGIVSFPNGDIWKYGSGQQILIHGVAPGIVTIKLERWYDPSNVVGNYHKECEITKKVHVLPAVCTPPATPVFTSPAASINAGTYPISWNPVPGAIRYDLRVDDQTTPWAGNCAVAQYGGDLCLSQTTTSTSHTFVAGHTYSMWVDVANACGSYATGVRAVTVNAATGAITGTFLLDNDANSSIDPATGLCRDSTAAPAGNIGTVRAVSGSNTYTGVLSGSNYTISGVPISVNAQVNLTVDGAQYRCVCPAGCAYSGIQPPKSGVNFYVSAVREPWWQSANGLIYAGNKSGTAISSLIPTTCTTAVGCRPFLSLWDSLRTTGSSAFTLTGGGGVNNINTLREDPVDRTARITGLTLNGPTENYDYFAQLYSMTNATNNWSGGKPGSGSYYTGNATTISGGAWTVNSGEKIVIFVNNSLRIDTPIQVAQGGFLAFIVKGNLTIGRGVGNTDPDDASPNVAGVYISDGSLIIEGGQPGGDLRFVGEGTFVGWSGVQLQRVFANTGLNASTPTDLFRFRPDFMNNVPDQMTKPIYIWQETN